MSFQPDKHVQDVTEKISGWSKQIVCYPTWPEICEFHALLSKNKFKKTITTVTAIDARCMHAASWLQRCNINGIGCFDVFDKLAPEFEKKYGPRTTWPTKPEESFVCSTRAVQNSQAEYKQRLQEAIKKERENGTS